MTTHPTTQGTPSARPKHRSGRYTHSQTINRGPLKGLPKRSKTNRNKYLTERQIREFLAVEAMAENRGTPFTAHLTIHWQCDPSFQIENWSKRLQRFLNKLRRWLDRNTIPIAFAWLNEVGEEYGAHTHLLLYIPKPKNTDPGSYRRTIAALEDFLRASENMADRLDRFGKPWLAVLTKPNEPNAFGAWTRSMRSGWCRYWLKGMDPEDVAYTAQGAEPLAAALGIRPERASTLPPSLQRFGASRTLGPKARREANFPELRGLDELRARLNPV